MENFYNRTGGRAYFMGGITRTGGGKGLYRPDHRRQPWSPYEAAFAISPPGGRVVLRNALRVLREAQGGDI